MSIRGSLLITIPRKRFGNRIHNSSQPDFAGIEILKALKEIDLEDLEEGVREMRRNPNNDPYSFCNPDLMEPDEVLVGMADGSVDRYIWNDRSFGFDGIWCEWVYEVDLVRSQLVIYESLRNLRPKSRERFYDPKAKHPGCSELIRFDLKHLPDEKTFLSQISEAFHGGNNETA